MLTGPTYWGHAGSRVPALFCVQPKYRRMALETQFHSFCPPVDFTNFYQGQFCAGQRGQHPPPPNEVTGGCGGHSAGQCDAAGGAAWGALVVRGWASLVWKVGGLLGRWSLGGAESRSLSGREPTSPNTEDRPQTLSKDQLNQRNCGPGSSTRRMSHEKLDSTRLKVNKQSGAENEGKCRATPRSSPRVQLPGAKAPPSRPSEDQG